MEYTWNTEEILRNSTSRINKEIILGEDQNNLSIFDPETFDYSEMNPLVYMYVFFYNKNIMKKYIPNIMEYIYNLYKIIDPNNIRDVRFMHQDGITEQYLINFIKQLSTYLDDKEISNIIDKIIDPSNHILRMDYKKNNNEMSNYVKGRVMKDLDHDLVLGSFYIRENLLDIPILAHEFGHMISALLFNKDINPWFYNFLGETEAYYLELLTSHFLSKEYNITDTTDAYRFYRLCNIESEIYNILIQDVISKHPLRNINTINRNIKKYGIQIRKDELDSILRNHSIMILGRIISYLIALELVNITVEDKKEGLKLYKRLLTDKENDLEKLLKKYDINITDPYFLKEEMKIRSRINV